MAVPREPGASAAKTLRYNQAWAILIGIQEYKDQALNLSYPVQDVEAVGETLLTCGFTKDRTIRLLNREATRQNIEDTVKDEMTKKTGPNDCLFVFFAGHGQDVKAGKRRLGYLLPYDIDPSKVASRGISMREIHDWDDLIPAKHILYAMDCCYGGLAATRRVGHSSARDGFLHTIMEEPVRQIITAGQAGEPVWEKDGHGIFTDVLIRGLKGAADVEGRGYVTGLDLGHYVTPRVVEETEGQQRPVFRYLEGDGEFVFFRNAPPHAALRPCAATDTAQMELSTLLDHLNEAHRTELTSTFDELERLQYTELVETLDELERFQTTNETQQDSGL